MVRRMQLVFVLALIAARAAWAVEPAYEGKYGNPEEPALRPYKWIFRGTGALFYQTGKGFKDGNMATPVLGTVETGRGLRKGTAELLESTWKGAQFAPVPPKGDYKETRNANARIDSEPFIRNMNDFAFTLPAYPILKLNDHYPLEDDQKVSIRNERARQVRAERKAAQAAREAARKPDEDVPGWKKAQQQYIGEQANYGAEKKKDYRGNLLKLAK